MKVGIVVWRLDYSGGTERQAVELALQLQRMGVDVTVYAFYFDPRKCFPDTTCKINKVKYLEKAFSFDGGFRGKVLGYIDMFRKSEALAELIDADTDILNCHEYHTYPVGVKFKKKTNTPVVGMLNDPPSCGAVYSVSQGPVRYLITLTKKLIFKQSIQALDKLIILDDLNRQRLRQYYGISNPVIVRSGLDVEKFPYYPQKQLSRDKVKIISVGSFCPWRRYEDVVSALRLLKNRGRAFEYHHVGTEKSNVKYARKIKRMVADLGLSDDVVFHGAVSEKEHVRLLADADILVFPNHPQTWGLVVFEALAVGIPVIATLTCGAAEVLNDGQNVLLVPPRSPEKIAENVVRLCDDPMLWQRLRTQGRRFVENNIGWNYYAQNVLCQFEDVLCRSRRTETAALTI